MRKTEMKEVTSTERVTTDILCNKCGESCQPKDASEREGQFLGWYGLIEATVGGGYYSTHLDDGFEYTFSLCEPCLYELFQTFKLKPSPFDALFNRALGDDDDDAA